MWDSTPTSTLCHLFPQGKHPWGDEFHGPHSANDTAPTQLSTRRSVSQLPKPAHHSPGCTFLVPPPGSCSCLSQGRKTGLKVWLWHRPARPAARRDLPPHPTQPQLTCQSWPRAREMQGHPSCACHPQPQPGTQCEGHPPHQALRGHSKNHGLSPSVTWTVKIPPVSVPTQCTKAVCKFT